MLDKIKKIRNQTGAGIVDIKNALQDAEGNEVKAIELLRKKGMERAMKKEDREVKEGIIASYVHTNGKVAAMVKLYCETDFVARNEEFIQLGKDLSMHISAMDPQALTSGEISDNLITKEREIWVSQLENKGKSGEIIEKILKGKEEKFRKDLALLSQPFVKNPDITIEELVKEKVAKVGENIQVGEFVRFEL